LKFYGLPLPRLTDAKFTVSVCGRSPATLRYRICGRLDEYQTHQNRRETLYDKEKPAAISQQATRSRQAIFWIDAICIKQGNTSERNHQVALMKEVYSSVWSQTPRTFVDLLTIDRSARLMSGSTLAMI
jgi:hypothetical protein